MKSKIFSLVIGFFCFGLISFSQQFMPTDGDAFYKKAMSSINIKHSLWVKNTAATVKQKNLDEAGVRKLATDHASQHKFNEMDIEGLVALVMAQVANDSEKDLRDALEEMKKTNEEKQKMREAQQAMEKNKEAMSKQMLDSFRLLAKSNVTPIQKTQTTKLQTAQTTTKVNTPINTKPSLTEVKTVQEEMRTKLDSMNELGQEQSTKMQLYMDRRTKANATLSNIMRKIAATQDSIIQNMK
jgi:hypothetical protein